MKRYRLLAIVLGCLLIAAGVAPTPVRSQLAGAPTIFDITPTSVSNGGESMITITGVGFVATPVVTLSIADGKPLVLTGVILSSPTTIQATVAAGTPEGTYSVTVYNPDGASSASTFQRLTVVRPGDQAMSSWSTLGELDGPRTHFAAVAIDHSLYLIGGFSGSGGWMALNSVVRAPIDGEGRLGPWVSAAPLARARGDHTVAQSDGYLYALGGAMGAGFPTEASVERARLNADGSVGPWELIGALPEVRFRAAAVVVGDSLLVMDGWASWSSDNPPGDTIRATIAPDGSLGPWSRVAGTAGRSMAAVAYQSFIYALNEDGTIERTVLGPDGSSGPWQQVASTAVNHRYGALAVMDGRLLVIGGQAGGYPDQYAITNVERAPIKADGSLGPWSAAPSLQAGHSSFAAATWDRWIYAVGDGTTTTSVGAIEVARALRLKPSVYLPLAGR